MAKPCKALAKPIARQEVRRVQRLICRGKCRALCVGCLAKRDTGVTSPVTSTTPSRTTYRSRRHFYVLMNATAHSLRRADAIAFPQDDRGNRFRRGKSSGRKQRFCIRLFPANARVCGGSFSAVPIKASLLFCMFLQPPPMWEANDVIHIDMTTTFSECRCVFRFVHAGISSDL